MDKPFYILIGYKADLLENQLKRLKNPEQSKGAVVLAFAEIPDKILKVSKNNSEVKSELIDIGQFIYEVYLNG